MAKRKAKRKSEKTEIKHSRIQIYLNAISIILAVAAIVISITTSNSQIDLEYIQSLPNLSVNAKINTDSNTGKDHLTCQIINDGGNIREAKITPHLYLVYMRVPQLVEATENRIVFEITDVFPANPAIDSNGTFYTPKSIMYNAQEHSWFLEVKKDRLTEANDLFFQIAHPLREKLLEGEFLWMEIKICLEVSYLDIRGDKQVEWFDISDSLDLIEEGSESSLSFQVRYMDKYSLIPLQVYQSARKIGIGEDLTQERNDEVLAIIDQLCCDALFDD